MLRLIRSEIENSALLCSLLTASGLKIVDIGGRGSAVQPNLARFAEYFVAEPDVQEAERLRHQLPREAPWRRTVVMPEAIASTTGEAHLFITHEPGMSSLLEPDLSEVDRLYLKEAFTVVGGATVKTTTLDAAAAKYGFGDADHLKLDTQGTELDILRSGTTVLPSLLTVVTEANFRPLYKGQSVFADVDTFLRQHGFSLVTLDRTNLRRAGHDESRYSKRIAAWAHCLYLREPRTLLADPDELLRRRVPRFVALALVFEHFDLAEEMIEVATERRVYPDAELAQLREEVAHVVSIGASRMLKKATKLGIAQEVMSLSARDRRRLGG